MDEKKKKSRNGERTVWRFLIYKTLLYFQLMIACLSVCLSSLGRNGDVIGKCCNDMVLRRDNMCFFYGTCDYILVIIYIKMRIMSCVIAAEIRHMKKL